MSIIKKKQKQNVPVDNCVLSLFSFIHCLLIVSLSNFIHWRKTWCQHVTFWELELSTPEWWAPNIPGK